MVSVCYFKFECKVISIFATLEPSTMFMVFSTEISLKMRLFYLSFELYRAFYFELRPRLVYEFRATSPEKARKFGFGRVGLSGRALPDPPLLFS